MNRSENCGYEFPSASIPARGAEPKGNAPCGRVFSVIDMTTDKGKN